MANATTFTVDSLPLIVALSAGVTAPTDSYFRVSTDGTTHVNASFVVSGAETVTGNLAVGGTFAVSSTTNLVGQLTTNASVNFIPSAGKLIFQTTIYASANVSAGLWIECLTSGGTKLFIPARAAVP